jgi:colanic acid/amylovoran biosynthesis glycosyltransferase
MSRLVPHKAIDELIHAIAELDCPSAFFVLAGEGPQREELARLCAEVLPGRYAVLGHVERSEVVLEAMDVFALPSASEGFGLVFVEAALAGVPGVGSRAGGVPEAIESGRTGLLVEPGDRPGLVAALASLQSPDLRTAMGERARARALEQFTEGAMSVKFLQLVGLR